MAAPGASKPLRFSELRTADNVALDSHSKLQNISETEMATFCAMFALLLCFVASVFKCQSCLVPSVIIAFVLNSISFLLFVSRE